MKYEDALGRAYDAMPKSVLEKERFEVPKVRGHLQGNRTVISNFHQIAMTLNRDVDHLLKYILKELATPGDLKKTGLIIGTKVGAARVNEKIKKYVDEFVICHECGKPDSKLLREGDFLYLKCQACGSKRIVKAKI